MMRKRFMTNLPGRQNINAIMTRGQLYKPRGLGGYGGRRPLEDNAVFTPGGTPTADLGFIWQVQGDLNPDIIDGKQVQQLICDNNDFSTFSTAPGGQINGEDYIVIRYPGFGNVTYGWSQIDAAYQSPVTAGLYVYFQANLTVPLDILIVAASLGPEQITNGGFTGSAVDWTLTDGWSYGNNNIVAVAASGYVQQVSLGIIQGRSYRVSYTISDYIDGSYRVSLYGVSTVSDGATRSANGNYSEVIRIGETASAASDQLRLATPVDGSCTVDNISVREIIPALGPELVINGGFDTGAGWTQGVAWIIGGGVASGVAATAGTMTQPIAAFEAGRTYRVSWTTLTNPGSAVVRTNVAGTDGNNTTSLGVQSQDIVAGGTGVFGMFNNAAFEGSIDNVSCREVLQA